MGSIQDDSSATQKATLEPRLNHDRGGPGQRAAGETAQRWRCEAGIPSLSSFFTSALRDTTLLIANELFPLCFYSEAYTVL